MSILAELARVKALFQARAIAAVIGAPMPDPDPFRLNAALNTRRAARPARQEAATRAAETRRERRA